MMLEGEEKNLWFRETLKLEGNEEMSGITIRGWEVLKLKGIKPYLYQLMIV